MELSPKVNHSLINREKSQLHCNQSQSSHPFDQSRMDPARGPVLKCTKSMEIITHIPFRIWTTCKASIPKVDNYSEYTNNSNHKHVRRKTDVSRGKSGRVRVIFTQVGQGKVTAMLIHNLAFSHFALFVDRFSFQCFLDPCNLTNSTHRRLAENRDRIAGIALHASHSGGLFRITRIIRPPGSSEYE